MNKKPDFQEALRDLRALFTSLGPEGLRSLVLCGGWAAYFYRFLSNYETYTSREALLTFDMDFAIEPTSTSSSLNLKRGLKREVLFVFKLADTNHLFKYSNNIDGETAILHLYTQNF